MYSSTASHICFDQWHRVGPGDIFASATRIAPALHSERANSSTAIREAETHYPSLQIRGFGDVDFSATNQKGSVSGFNLGQFVLHLASPLSKKVGYFGELSFTARPTGYDVQVERTIIQYDYNDYFKISFGKYHTPLGYWNISMLLGMPADAWLVVGNEVGFSGILTPRATASFCSARRTLRLGSPSTFI